MKTPDEMDPPMNILLVEDNPGDVRLMMEYLKESKTHHPMNVVPDGLEAMAYLRREGRYAGASRPALILLDLNLPKKNGLQVLAEIKQDLDLKRIPVVILTTSSAETDIIEAYNLHANCYITKPGNVVQFFQIMKAIEDFWLAIAQLPPREG